MNELEDRIIKLESLTAFQDHLIEQLNDVIYKQQLEIDDINNQISAVKLMMKENSTQEEHRTLADEKPPHY